MVVLPKPNDPVINVNNPICEGEDLIINSDFVGGAEYIWTGPFPGSTDQNFVISPATTANSGTYSLKVKVNGCESDVTNVNVTVKPKPVAPQYQ